MTERARDIDSEETAQCERRRTALVTILEHRADPILERVVTDTVRATEFGMARDAAQGHGFEPDELEDELRVFQRAFETRLFYGA